jgi:hypothetical protein
MVDRIPAKEMIEQMREELRLEMESLKKPIVVPGGKPKKPNIPSRPYIKRPLKPKKRQIEKLFGGKTK